MKHALAGAAACPICASMAGAALAGAEGTHWGYEGHEGPDHWAALSPDFKTCEMGIEQSPINLAGPVPAQVGAVKPEFHRMPLSIVNNGHTIQVNCETGSGTRIAGKSFGLLQFHFHHPSEHLLSGKAMEMECHFVHRSAEGQLAVLGVFIRTGRENAALKPIWANMPAHKGDPVRFDVDIDPAAILPDDRAYFRYYGSLTTPPCSEGVLWTVFAQPVEASKEQIEQFAKLFENNARPSQDLNRRFLLKGS